MRVKTMEGREIDLKAFSTDGTHINFLTEDESFERIEVALREGTPAARPGQGEMWDPQNVFRANRNDAARSDRRCERV